MKEKTITIKKLQKELIELRDTKDYKMEGNVYGAWDRGYDACIDSLEEEFKITSSERTGTCQIRRLIKSAKNLSWEKRTPEFYVLWSGKKELGFLDYYRKQWIWMQGELIALPEDCMKEVSAKLTQLTKGAK